MKNDIANVYCEVLQLATLYQFNAILDRKYVVKGVLLPNASRGLLVPTGCVIVTNDKPHTEWIEDSYGTLVIQTGFSYKDIKRNAEFIINDLIGFIKVGFIEISYGADNSVWVLIRSKGNKRDRVKLWDSVSKILQVYSWWGYIVQQMLDVQEGSIEKRGNSYIHRMGAIKSSKNKMGITLGNVRDGSFITSGKGFRKSTTSSACYSGVILQSPKSKVTMDGQVIDSCLKDVFCIRDEGFCFKPPYIYKNPFHVMDQQEKMVDVLYHIKPLIHIRW